MATSLSIKQALRVLDGSEPGGDQARAEAARVLGEHGDPAAVTGLIGALDDRDWAVRASAVRALGRIGDRRAARALIARLEDVENVSCSAARALGRLRSVQAVDPLVDALRVSQSAMLREAAATALGALGSKQAIEPLIGALGDGAAQVRKAAAAALERLGEGGIAQITFSALQGHAAGLVGLEILSADGDRRVTRALIGALEAGDGDVRVAAAEGLGRLGDSRACPALIGALGDRHGGVRAAAFEALVALGEGDAASVVRGALQGKDQARAQLWVLVSEGDERVLVPVLRALRAGVRFAGGDCRGELSPEPARLAETARRLLVCVARLAVQPLIGMLDDPQFAGEAACGLAVIWRYDRSTREGMSRAATPLLRMLGDDDPDTRRIAADALAALGKGKLAQAVLGALSGDEGSLEQLRALSDIGDKSAVAPLVARLEDGQKRTRERAARGLGAVGDRRAVASLVCRLSDDTEDVRRSALQSLGQIGDGRAVEPLLARLNDRNESLQVRLTALAALQQIGDVSSLPHLRRLLSDTAEPGELRARVACSIADALPEGGVVSLLLRLIGDEARPVRKLAAERLATLGEGPLAQAVVRALDGDRAAMQQLREMADAGDGRGLRPLLQRLDDPDETVRRCAAQALVTMGPRHVTTALIQRLGDQSPRRRVIAAQILAAIGEERLAFGVANASLGKAEAFELLREMASEGDWRGAEPLAMRLGCESDKGGAAATAALKTMGLAAVPALAAALTASLLPEAGAKGPWGPVGGDEHNRAVQRAVELLAAALRPMSSLRPEHARLLQPPLREGLPHWRRVTGTLSRLPREVREPLRQVVSASQRLAA